MRLQQHLDDTHVQTATAVNYERYYEQKIFPTQRPSENFILCQIKSRSRSIWEKTTLNAFLKRTKGEKMGFFGLELELASET